MAADELHSVARPPWASTRSRRGGRKDLVCGMIVDPHTAKHRHEYGVRTYYFCSARCKEKFANAPAQYLTSETKPALPVPEGTIYTCPMHPQIRQVGPGNCPICGMALEPELVTAVRAQIRSLRRYAPAVLGRDRSLLARRRSRDGGHLTGLHHWLGQQTSNWLQLLLATPVVLWAGWPFFVRGVASVRTGNLNMFTLIAMGTGVAWIYSIVGTLLPDLFSRRDARRGRRGFGLFRGGCGHHRARASRTGPRA